MEQKELTDVEKEVNDRIIRNLKYLFKVRKEIGKSIYDFGNKCKEKYNINVNAGNVFALLKNGGKIRPALLYYLCEYLNVDLQEIMWKEMEEVIPMEFLKVPIESDKFIISANDMEKYLGKYFCYFYAPEKPSRYDKHRKLITGTLELDRDIENGDVCKVKFCVNTGIKKKETGGNEKKNYFGQMFVSRTLSIAYILLSNRKMGEVIFITFPYNQQLCVKDNIGMITFVCACSTNEISKVPVVYRMLCCRNDLKKKKQLGKLESNLLLNTSKIKIEKNKLENLLKKWTDGKVIQDTLEQLRNIDQGVELKEIYEIKEFNLRGMNKEKLEKMTIEEVVAEIRKEAMVDKYNKISLKLEERIVKTLLDEDE